MRMGRALPVDGPPGNTPVPVPSWTIPFDFIAVIWSDFNSSQVLVDEDLDAGFLVLEFRMPISQRAQAKYDSTPMLSELTIVLLGSLPMAQ